MGVEYVGIRVEEGVAIVREEGALVAAVDVVAPTMENPTTLLKNVLLMMV